MKTDPIFVGAHFDEFIEGQVAAGRYDSPSDVVRAGLRLLEEHEARLEALRAALVDGEQSGDTGPLDIEALIAQKRAEARKS